jgi:serine/threonine protein kinase
MWRDDNAADTSGTPGYMAPEVMCRLNHTVSVDYFAVGVMAFECMFGRVSDIENTIVFLSTCTLSC